MIGRFFRYIGGFGLIFGPLFLLLMPQNLNPAYIEGIVGSWIFLLIGFWCYFKERKARILQVDQELGNPSSL